MIELITLAGALSFGTFEFWGFWVTALVAIMVLVGLTEGEHYGWATVLFIVSFVALTITGVFDIYVYTIHHPVDLVIRIGEYVLVGVVWGVFKWFLYCRKERARYEQAKQDFLRAAGVTEMTSGLRVLWTEKLKNRSVYDRFTVVNAQAPLASNNKEKIINWMYLWPFSVLGTIMNGLIRQLWEAFFTWLNGVYNNISKHVWKGTENDLASEEDLATASAAERKRLFELS